MGVVEDHRRKTRTINVAPTWASVLPVYLEAYANTRNSAAMTELKRMAGLADERNAMARRIQELEKQLSDAGWRDTMRQQERSGGTM